MQSAAFATFAVGLETDAVTMLLSAAASLDKDSAVYTTKSI